MPLQRAHLKQVGPDGKESLGQCRRAHGIEPTRPGQYLTHGHAAELRVAAAVGQRAHLIPQCQIDDVRAKSRDLSGDLESEDGTGIGRDGVSPQALQDIGTIDAGRVHADQHLLRCGTRHRGLRHLQHLRAAGARAFDQIHLTRQGRRRGRCHADPLPART